MNYKYTIKKTIDLYKNAPGKNIFARIRFWDAPYIEVEKLIPKKAKILDLGCGEGIFTNFIALCSPDRKIIGVDLDRNRIAEADRGLTNVSFKYGDATKFKIPKSDVIIMFHLLHHLLSHDLQEKLIKKCISSLNKNGKLIIVEVDKEPFFKYLISWFTDHFIVALLFEKRFYEPNIFFRKNEEWTQLFREFGLDIKMKDLSDNKPFSHKVFELTKKSRK